LSLAQKARKKPESIRVWRIKKREKGQKRATRLAEDTYIVAIFAGVEFGEESGLVVAKNATGSSIAARLSLDPVQLLLQFAAQQ